MRRLTMVALILFAVVAVSIYIIATWNTQQDDTRPIPADDNTTLVFNGNGLAVVMNDDVEKLKLTTSDEHRGNNTEVSSPSFVIDKPFSTTPVLYEEEKAVGMLIYDHGTREFRFEGGNVTESARLYLEELNRQSKESHIKKGPSPDFVTWIDRGMTIPTVRKLGVTKKYTVE